MAMRNLSSIAVHGYCYTATIYFQQWLWIATWTTCLRGLCCDVGEGFITGIYIYIYVCM